MSSCIQFRDQCFWTSNSRFFLLIELGLELGEKTARSDDELRFIDLLREREQAFYPGCGLDVEEDFPTVEERKFWARVYHDVAYLVYQRELGNQDNQFWQPSFIAAAHSLGDYFTRAVQQVELAWHPESMASQAARTWYEGRH